MLKGVLASLVIVASATPVLMSAPSRESIDSVECRQLHGAMRNHIETVYLVQMAEFLSARTRDAEENPELKTGISAAFEEIVEALGHYDGAGTRRAIDVVLKLCPL